MAAIREKEMGAFIRAPNRDGGAAARGLRSCLLAGQRSLGGPRARPRGETKPRSLGGRTEPKTASHKSWPCRASSGFLFLTKTAGKSSRSARSRSRAFVRVAFRERCRYTVRFDKSWTRFMNRGPRTACSDIFGPPGRDAFPHATRTGTTSPRTRNIRNSNRFC